jgi:DUF4097 and DUF4098 domain-containing protein YvlB
VSAHDGDIVVTNVSGPVTTTSMRGRQHLADVAGRVNVDDTYGDLALEAITGESLAARVHRGTVTATRIRSGAVSILMTFGDIHFRGELLAGGRYELRSYHGNVDARTTGAFQVDAQSRDGAVEPAVELRNLLRESGRVRGYYGGTTEKPAILLMSSTAGRVTFGLGEP